jgi:hypothetical protein
MFSCAKKSSVCGKEHVPERIEDQIFFNVRPISGTNWHTRPTTVEVRCVSSQGLVYASKVVFPDLIMHSAFIKSTAIIQPHFSLFLT